MKVYIAAPYAARDMVRELVLPELLANGHETTSRWLNGTRAIVPGVLGTAPDTDRATVWGHASADLQDAGDSDALLHITAGYCCTINPALDVYHDQLMSGGRNVETGFALARGIPVLLVGPPENIFQRTMAHQCETLTDAMATLNGGTL